MNSTEPALRPPAFRLSRTASTRLSFLLGLGLTGAATFGAAPALYAQQSGARTDLAIQADVLKALANYPDISGEHITANTHDGIVTLAGTASSDTTKSQAQVVAATVDGVRSVVNNVTVTGGGSNQAAAQNESQNEAQPLQQAQSSNPDQQQAPYTPQSQPKPGTNGNWGQAGPPPDVANGQIPAPPQDDAAQQGATPQQAGQQAPPSAGSQPGPQAGSQPDQYPMQDPGGQDDGPPPQQQQRPAYGNPNAQNQQPPYPQQGYPPPQPYARPPYQGRPYPGADRTYAAPNLSKAPITVQPGLIFTVRTSEPLDSRRLLGGENFQAVLAQDIYQGQYLVIPRGAVLQGHVVGVKKPGALRGDAGFALQIVSLNLSGQNYPIATDTFATDTRGKGGYTTANTVGGAAIGALIGAAAGGGPGAAIGAVAGGVTGVGLSAASSGPREIMPPETLLTFHLRAPLTVNPISAAEVQSLQASATPPRRMVRPRSPYPYGYYPPPPPPPYYYPYPYRYWR